MLHPGRNHCDAVGFCQSRRDLGHLLTCAGTDRSDQPGLGFDQRPQVLAKRADLVSSDTGQLHRFPESLVHRQLLEDRHTKAQRVERAFTENRVQGHPWRQYHRSTTDHPACLMHRHCRSRTKNSRFVTCPGHHPAPAQAADQHRATSQSGTRQLLGGSEKRIHVEMQHPPTTSCGITLIHRALRFSQK